MQSQPNRLLCHLINNRFSPGECLLILHTSRLSSFVGTLTDSLRSLALYFHYRSGFQYTHPLRGGRSIPPLQSILRSNHWLPSLLHLAPLSRLMLDTWPLSSSLGRSFAQSPRSKTAYSTLTTTLDTDLCVVMSTSLHQYWRPLQFYIPVDASNVACWLLNKECEGLSSFWWNSPFS